MCLGVFSNVFMCSALPLRMVHVLRRQRIKEVTSAGLCWYVCVSVVFLSYLTYAQFNVKLSGERGVRAANCLFKPFRAFRPGDAFWFSRSVAGAPL